MQGALFLDGGIAVADLVFGEVLFKDTPELLHVWTYLPRHPLQVWHVLCSSLMISGFIYWPVQTLSWWPGAWQRVEWHSCRNSRATAPDYCIISMPMCTHQVICKTKTSETVKLWNYWHLAITCIVLWTALVISSPASSRSCRFHDCCCRSCSVIKVEQMCRSAVAEMTAALHASTYTG